MKRNSDAVREGKITAYSWVIIQAAVGVVNKLRNSTPPPEMLHKAELWKQEKNRHAARCYAILAVIVTPVLIKKSTKRVKSVAN